MPADYLPGEIRARTQLPASRSGAVVLLIDEKGMGMPKAMLAGRQLRLEPVWSDQAYYVCPWRAWRAEVDPNQGERQLQVTVETQQSLTLPQFTAYFLPR